MDFSNLKMSFYLKGNAKGTNYTFGKSTIDILWDEENFELIYSNQGEKKIQIFSNDLPKLLAIQVKNLYLGFDIDSHEIQSCIWNIQSYLRRCANNQ